MVMRGLKKEHEQDPHLLLRDTRTIGKRISDFLSNPTSATVILAAFAAASFTVPALADVLFLLGLGIFIFNHTRKDILPFRLPIWAGVDDHNDLKPGSGQPYKARGICFFGNDKETGEELWFHNEDMRTHVLIFGSTGAGKTETLISLAFNALAQGSGFIYVDGKGDNTLFAKIFSMVRKLGREDDLLLINFMTGARDIAGPQEKRLSNTMNPFANGSSSMLAQLVISMMDQSSASPDGDMWKGRAISFVEALMKILVYARDQGYILLDANTIRTYFSLERIETISQDKIFPRDGGLPAVSIADVPDVILQPLENYMLTLPGYDKSKKGKQVSQVWEQHGFITMQLTRVFTSLADTYGHILRTNLAEVDFKDVVLNRRILVALLPALEKSPDELSNLGKIIVATLKAMMAAGLGEEVEGDYRDLVARKPTNAPTPFMCILDEYGYYAVPGFAVVPAQARSLGFSAIFAGQDLPAFQKASKEEAMSIGANTNIKIAMKLEDPIETWEFFSKTAGEAYVTKVDAFQTNAQSVLNNYLDTRSSSAETRARINLLDLKDQGMGEAHFFFKSRIVRGQTFFANPPAVKKMRLTHFLKVERPDEKELAAFEQTYRTFEQAQTRYDQMHAEEGSETEDINFITEKLRENDGASPIERGVGALLEFHNRTTPEAVVTEEVDELPEDRMSVFTPGRLTERVLPLLVIDDIERFGRALVDRQIVRGQMEQIERIAGKSAQHSANITIEVIKDLDTATVYPPETVTNVSIEHLTQVTREFIQALRDRQNANQ